MWFPKERRRFATVLTLFVFATMVLWTVLAPEAVAGYRARVLRMVNATRENRGLHTLRIDASLSRQAMRHTNQMIDRNAIYDPTNLSQLMSGEPWSSIAASVVGCAGTLRGLHRAFMHHAAHREIILNPDLRWIGVGVKKDYARNACGRGWFWGTELFYG
jgi:uncharacterized protein YkwD